MPLCKLARLGELTEGRILVKEAYGRGLVLTIHDGQPICVELPDIALANQDVSTLRAIGKVHHLYRDKDGELWINLVGCETAAPPARLHQQGVPQAHQQPQPLQEAFGLNTQAPPPGSYPTPLVPFAGCDKKAPPPSPAKPFSLAASPLKPSPFKERVDTATEAVVRKNWGSRQAKMGEFFGRAPASKAQSEPVQHMSFMDTDF